MSSKIKFCIFCKETIHDEVKFFTPERLESCLEILHIKQKYSLIGNDFKLTKEVNNVDGFIHHA